MLCWLFASLCIINFVVIIRKFTLLKRFLPNLSINKCIPSRQPDNNSKIKTGKIQVMFSLLFSISGIKEAHLYSTQLCSLKIVGERQDKLLLWRSPRQLPQRTLCHNLVWRSSQTLCLPGVFMIRSREAGVYRQGCMGKMPCRSTLWFTNSNWGYVETDTSSMKLPERNHTNFFSSLI